jgi:hypothetical protein
MVSGIGCATKAIKSCEYCELATCYCEFVANFASVHDYSKCYQYFMSYAVWLIACLSRATCEPIGSRFLKRGFDVVSILVLLVDESFECLAGVCADECGDAGGGSVGVRGVSVVDERAGEAAEGGGCAFDLVRGRRPKIKRYGWAFGAQQCCART